MDVQSDSAHWSSLESLHRNKHQQRTELVTDSHGGPCDQFHTGVREDWVSSCLCECLKEEKQLSPHGRKPPIIHPVPHIYRLLYAAEVQPFQSSYQRLNVSMSTSHFPQNSKLTWSFIHIHHLSVWSHLGCSSGDSHSCYCCCGSTSCCSQTVCHHPTSSSPAGETVDLQ